MKKVLKKILVLFLALLLVTGLGFVSYFSVYYKAKTYETSDRSVTIREEDDHIALIPKAYEDVFIFYPGAKVEAEAYVPLLKRCAEKGVLCLIVKPPLHFALLDVNAADALVKLYPQGKRYFLGGHSLGGACASMYISRHLSDYEGLILLASYSNRDLSSSDLEVLDIYGDRDEVLNKEKHEEALKYLPSDFRQLVIKGGNHAWFGSYGPQKGDGEALIREEEQQDLTADAIVDFIRNAS